MKASETEITRFPEGEKYLRIKDYLDGQDVVIIQSIIVIGTDTVLRSATFQWLHYSLTRSEDFNQTYAKLDKLFRHAASHPKKKCCN